MQIFPSVISCLNASHTSSLNSFFIFVWFYGGLPLRLIYANSISVLRLFRWKKFPSYSSGNTLFVRNVIDFSVIRSITVTSCTVLPLLYLIPILMSFAFILFCFNYSPKIRRDFQFCKYFIIYFIVCEYVLKHIFHLSRLLLKLSKFAYLR